MKAKLSYEKAFGELTRILEEIEQEKIQLDELADKMKRARELLTFCKTTLRQAEEAVEKADRTED